MELTLRRVNLIIFVIVVAIILFSVVRAILDPADQGKRPEPRRGPAAAAQAVARHG
jgi:hypothetical protein